MFCIHLCWNHLLWAFAAGILWKTQPWDIFARVRTAKCIASRNHDGCLEDNYLFHSSSWNFSSPHYVTYFVRQRLQKFTEKVTSKVPFREISWENIHFCVLKKETLFPMGGKYKWILLKNMLSSSLVDIIFLCTFLL